MLSFMCKVLHVLTYAGRDVDSSVGKAYASHTGDPSLNPSGGLTWVTSMHE